MTRLVLQISEQSVPFLVDSGATESVIMEKEFEIKSKLSGRYTRTMGASGTSVLKNIQHH